MWDIFTWMVKAVPVSILAYGHPPELEALHDAVVLEIVEDDGIRRLHDVLPILCILEDGAVPLLERGGILDLGDGGVVDQDFHGLDALVDLSVERLNLAVVSHIEAVQGQAV